ncbi:cupin domain-containing protein [Pseudochelatococcus sp. B33]
MADPKALPALLSGAWRDLPYEPFRDGVDVHYLWRQRDAEGPVWAFLRYKPGTLVPRHRHTGLETIVAVDGSQSDERGYYETGSVICNPEGTEHSVWTENGCTVFIQWKSPVLVL